MAAELPIPQLGACFATTIHTRTARYEGVLDRLPSDEYACFFDHLEEVKLSARQPVAHEPYTHVLFPTTGVISMLVPMGDEPSVEAAVVGFEGMLGLPVMMGDGRDLHEISQVDSTTWQMPSSTFLRLLPECRQLQQTLGRYALALLNQTSRSSACNRMHDINQRLARWLLLVHDRMPGDEFTLTQEFLSEMLACADQVSISPPKRSSMRVSSRINGVASRWSTVDGSKRLSVVTISRQSTSMSGCLAQMRHAHSPRSSLAGGDKCISMVRAGTGAFQDLGSANYRSFCGDVQRGLGGPVCCCGSHAHEIANSAGAPDTDANRL